MDTSIPACPDGWIRSVKRVHAGTFSLSGLSCDHALTPERNSAGNLKRHRGHDGIIYVGNLEDSLTPNAEPIDGIRHIKRAWDTPVAQSAYTHLQTRCEYRLIRPDLRPSLHHTPASGWMCHQSSQLIVDYGPSRPLHSMGKDLLVVPRSRTVTASRAFHVPAAQTWNSLPQHIWSASSIISFRGHLKTHLFDIAYK